MLVLDGSMAGSCPSGRSSAIPSILDSPTLARVERAMLRHEEGVRRDGALLQRTAYTQSLLPTSYGSKDAYNALKKGLLWQHRDRLFSRWKERYFILTRDYLHCFRRASGTDRISEMGQFLFKVKLVDVDRVEWENKRTYSTVALILMGRDGKIYLRATDGLEDWFELLEECTLSSKERRRAFRNSCDDKSRDNNNVSSCLDDWLADRQKLSGRGRLLDSDTDSVSTRQDTVKRREWLPRDEDWENPAMDNRLSLLTDIDINIYDDDTIGTTSVTSYRINEDVLCIQPPSLRNTGTFRSPKDSNLLMKPGETAHEIASHIMRFRERSHSDIQRVDRRNWRPRNHFE